MTLLSNLEALHRRQGRSPASQAGDGQNAQQEASPVAQATVSAHSTAGEGYSLSHSNSHLGHGPNSFDVRTLIPPHPVDWSAMHRIIAARAREASLTQRQASRLSVDWDLNGLERGTTRPTLPSSEQTSQEQVHPADLDETSRQARISVDSTPDITTQHPFNTTSRLQSHFGDSTTSRTLTVSRRANVSTGSTPDITTHHPFNTTSRLQSHLGDSTASRAQNVSRRAQVDFHIARPTLRTQFTLPSTLLEHQLDDNPVLGRMMEFIQNGSNQKSKKNNIGDSAQPDQLDPNTMATSSSDFTQNANPPVSPAHEHINTEDNNGDHLDSLSNLDNAGDIHGLGYGYGYHVSLTNEETFFDDAFSSVMQDFTTGDSETPCDDPPFATHPLLPEGTEIHQDEPLHHDTNEAAEDTEIPFEEAFGDIIDMSMFTD
ncbi:uncharacterized protein N7458_011343 [Penicillium daleae]|uniref:Uncharacterized protein n=1 Tax=Penicillium daleae TaxID=63821 RepID=A0AAD6BRV3_9EURO|nr:uncharacterized protein N7458_011343 [Penicillium daleae]KAJ5432187.1 hypothetical protein N7458_011343 [Penicillium daleae]